MATREGRQVWLLVIAAAAAMLPVMALAQAVAPATAPPPGITGMPQNVYDASVEALTKLAVIAIILEQALALIFDWKPFRETFDRKAVKPLVSFLFAAGIVNEFGLDVLHTLIDAYGGSPQGAGVLSKLVVVASTVFCSAWGFAPIWMRGKNRLWRRPRPSSPSCRC